MSKLAQAVQDAVDAIADGTDSPVVNTAESGEGDQMTTKAKRVKKPKAARVAKAAKPKAEKKVRAKKAKGEKKARRARKTNGEAAGRITMVYQLTDGIPATLRDPSATRTILEAIKERGKATKKELAEDLGPKFPDPTLRFNLWKMHTAGVLTVVSA